MRSSSRPPCPSSAGATPRSCSAESSDPLRTRRSPRANSTTTATLRGPSAARASWARRARTTRTLVSRTTSTRGTGWHTICRREATTLTGTPTLAPSPSGRPTTPCTPLPRRAAKTTGSSLIFATPPRTSRACSSLTSRSRPWASPRMPTWTSSCRTLTSIS